MTKKKRDMRLIKATTAQILKVWKANREFRIKDATVQDFEASYDGFERLLKEVEAKSSELDKLREVRDKTAAKLWAVCSRARSGVRGYFGPHSPQYKQVMATPDFKRIKRPHKAKPAAAASPVVA